MTSIIILKEMSRILLSNKLQQTVELNYIYSLKPHTLSESQNNDLSALELNC
jgi:hypothetical protein